MDPDIDPLILRLSPTPPPPAGDELARWGGEGTSPLLLPSGLITLLERVLALTLFRNLAGIPDDNPGPPLGTRRYWWWESGGCGSLGVAKAPGRDGPPSAEPVLTRNLEGNPKDKPAVALLLVRVVVPLLSAGGGRELRRLLRELEDVLDRIPLLL